MKLRKIKVIAFITAVLLCFLGFTFSVAAAPDIKTDEEFLKNREEISKADFNDDGFISKGDIFKLAENLLNENSAENCDINGDGKDNIIDLVALTKCTLAVAPKIWLSSNGDDQNIGAEDSPVASLNRALELVECGGEIVIKGEYAPQSDFKWKNHFKNVKISGGTLDCRNLGSLKIEDSVIFDDITIIFNDGSRIYANGHSMKIGLNAEIIGQIICYGGKHYDSVESTDVTLLSGNFSSIYGGGNAADVLGDVNLYVGGNVNNIAEEEFTMSNLHIIYGGSNVGNVHGNVCATVEGEVNKNLDYKNHESLATAFGGCSGGEVKGEILLNIGGDAKFNYIFGGGIGEKADVGEKITLNFSAKAMSVIGGSVESDLNCDVAVNILGGWTEQVFGGCEKASLNGNTEVNLLGGTVTRRIFGGCYNYLKRNLIFIKWESDHHVMGNTTVNISEKANLEFSFSTNGIDDLGISASSRHRKNFADENAKIVFLDSKAEQKYGGNIGIKTSSYWADLILKFAKPYDSIMVK